jgi:RNA polymerase sigma factor (sigma-70 family)
VVGLERPTSHEELVRMSDAQLVAHARERMAAGEAGLETAGRCLALVFERNRDMVRAVCAGKAPVDIVDDLQEEVYERFVRTVYLRTEPIQTPSGLLFVMARRVVATFQDRRKPASAPLDDLRELMVDDDGYDEVAADEVVTQLLGLLTNRQREVVWARLFGGHTSAEIAAQLQISSGNVDVIFFRAMDRLRKEVER